MMKASFRVLIIACLIILFDQVSKDWILASIAPAEIVPIVPNFFNLTLTFNPGVAFGFLANLPDTQRSIALCLTTVIALSVLLYLFLKDYRENSKAQMALALIVGGAFGNLIDRFRHGEVVDFLDFYWGTYHWPAFNVADSAICVGVTFLILHTLLVKSAAPKP